MHESLTKLANKLSEFTGAPYVVLTDCCTHAVEVCLRLQKPKHITMPCRTYISMIMVLEKLDIDYTLVDTKWIGEYKLQGSTIWDSARLLSPNMYKKGEIKCISFGNGKPIDNKRGGAILLDDFDTYEILTKMCYDGRDMNISPWIDQKTFNVGYHYNMPFEHAEKLYDLLLEYIDKGKFEPVEYYYPDCRTAIIKK